MRDVVIDLATILEVLLDLSCICNPIFFTLLIIFVLFFVFNAIAICVELGRIILILLILCVSLLSFSFLEGNFGAKLFKELVRLFENLHQSRVSLCVEQLDIVIEVICLKQFKSLSILVILLLLLFLVLLVEEIFR